MTVIGAVLLVILAPAAAVIGILIGVKGGLDNITHAPVVASGQSQHVAAGQDVMLFSYLGPSSGGDGVSDSSGTSPAPPGTCQVTDSSGKSIDLTPATSSLRISRNGASYREAGHFTATRDDDYRISCGNHPAMVLDADVTKHLARDIIVPIAVGVGAAIVIGLIGLALLIIGIVRITRSNREMREFDQQQAFAYGGPGPYPPQGGQYPPQGPYPPQGGQYPQQGPYPPGGPSDPYGPKS